MKLNKKTRFSAILLILLLLAGCTSVPEDVVITNTDTSAAIASDPVEEVTIDGITYTNYKGPVQGEIKYQEGKPASENVQALKASGDIGSPYQIDLVVTNNFGHQEMFNKEVGLVKDEVGMEVLFRNLDIATAYGGGFVNEINGLESGFTFYTGDERKKADWFYWVNGILAPVGVAEYRPQPGDIIWWDYHDWSVTMFIPAVVGSYPQPFKSGYGGVVSDTVILYDDSFKSDAETLQQSLREHGVQTVLMAEYTPEMLQDPDHYVIALGTWTDLSEGSEFLTTLNKKNKMVGVYGKFTEAGLSTIDFKGQVIETYNENAGFIFAHSPGINGLKPFWCITGTDELGVKNALNLLLESPEKVQQMFSVVVSGEKVINCPYVE
ncbi:MAG: DUF4430 domain-containing protein [Clostridia bacterium]|nr:DUF4430 domain-containing protein [Clostridia bacterium]